jgi:excisionase family DNA binding protein
MQPTQIAVNGTDDPKLSAPLLLSADKLAELLNISVRTLWRLRAAGTLPRPLRIGGSIRWRFDEISQWIDAGCPHGGATNLPQQTKL